MTDQNDPMADALKAAQTQQPKETNPAEDALIQQAMVESQAEVAADLTHYPTTTVGSMTPATIEQASYIPTTAPSETETPPAATTSPQPATTTSSPESPESAKNDTMALDLDDSDDVDSFDPALDRLLEYVRSRSFNKDVVEVILAEAFQSQYGLPFHTDWACAHDVDIVARLVKLVSDPEYVCDHWPGLMKAVGDQCGNVDWMTSILVRWACYDLLYGLGLQVDAE